MPHLKVSLFGAPQILVDDLPVETGRRKALALVAYLAVMNQPHTRDTLATLLWADYSQVNARAALRQALKSLRRSIGDNWLQIEREQVLLKENENSWIDTSIFHRLVTDYEAHKHNDGLPCFRCMDMLTNAVELYRNDFMTGFTLPNSANFDEWQAFQTDKFRQQLALALAGLVRGHSADRNFQAAIKCVQRWLVIDPFHEPAHRFAMQLYAWSDQRTLALRQYEACQKALGELGVSPEATSRDLYAAITNGPIPLPPSRPTDQSTHSMLKAHLPAFPVHNLPSRLTPFLARKTELTQVADLLADPSCRLLTLTGLGGIGKTRLALEAAEAQVNCFAQGVYFVGIAALNSLEALVQAIASALHFLPQGAETLKAQLFRSLHEKEILLVLDNFENLLDGALLVSELLEAAPRAKVLVTSREPLALREEWLMRVEGMPYPDSRDRDLDAIEGYDAVQLFVQSARRVKPSFTLSAELPFVVQICQLMEGMPLGIELAAGNLYTMTCGQIAEQIQQNIDILTTSLRNIPQRHRSLHAAFEHSWKFLITSEKNTLMNLSEFRGGFTSEAAIEVAGATPAILQVLVEKSLIDIDPGGRYDIHQMLRQFAEEKLVESGDQDTLRQLHLNYFCRLAERAATRLRRDDQLEWLNRLDLDQGNLQIAFQRAVESETADIALRLAGALWRYWEIRIPWLEARTLIARALAIPGGTPLSRARALAGIGAVARVQGDYQAAGLYLTEALNLYRQLNDRLGIAHVLTNQGSIAYKQADYRGGQPLIEEALRLCRAEDDQVGVAFALQSLSALLLEEGNASDEAKLILREALAIREKLGDKLGIAYAKYNMGILAHDAGDFDTARAYYQDCLTLYNELGDQRNVATVLYNLGDIANGEGDYETSRALLEACLAIRTELGDKRGRAFLAQALADLAIAQNDLAGAQTLLGESLTYFHEAGEKRNLIYSLQGLAQTARLMGDPIRAARLLGFANGLTKAINFTIPEVDRSGFDSEKAAIHAQLGDAGFLTEYNEGIAMTLDEAVNFALA